MCRQGHVAEASAELAFLKVATLPRTPHNRCIREAAEFVGVPSGAGEVVLNHMTIFDYLELNVLTQCFLTNANHHNFFLVLSAVTTCLLQKDVSYFTRKLRSS